MKRHLLFLVLCVVIGLPAAAQTTDVTKVGLCDFTRVLLTAYKDTKAYRDYDQMSTDVSKEITRMTNELTDLQSQKLDADKATDKTKSLALQKTIADKQSYLDTYKTVKRAVLAQQASALMTGTVLKEIMDVVKFIAEGGGYSIILRSDDAGTKSVFLYWIPEVDITQSVIDEILKRQGKASGG